MTGPGAISAGDLSATVRLDTSHIPDDFRDGLTDGVKKTRDDQDRAGRLFADGLNRGFRRNVFGDVAGILAARTAVGVVAHRGRFRRLGTSIVTYMSQGILEGGGTLRTAFQTIAQTLGPILGSIFNVSGRSPVMFGVLIVAIGALIALVVGLIHGLHALMSLLAAIPNLLFAIGLQAGALIFIFNGFFEAIGNLGAAKNIEELNEALKDTNPAMAAFIKTLWPFREFLKEVSEASKTAFFSQLVTAFQQLYVALHDSGALLYAMSTVAGGLGRLVANIVGFFSTGQFTTFLRAMADQTVMWLDKFGPAVVRFLEGLTRFGTATLPYVQWFGMKFNEWIASLGRWFDKLANPGSGFLDWIERAKTTISIFLDVLGEIWKTLKIIIQNIDKAGGDAFLVDIFRAFHTLNELIQSAIGVEGMRGFIRTLRFLLEAAAAAIIAITVIFAVLSKVYDGIAFTLEGLGLLFKRLWELLRWLYDKITSTGQAAFLKLRGYIITFLTTILTFRNNIYGFFVALGQAILNFLKSIPDMVTGILGDIGTAMLAGGRALVDNFVQGIKERLGPLGEILSWIRRQISNAFSLSTGTGGVVQRRGTGASAAGVAPGGAAASGLAIPGLGITNNAQSSTQNVALESGAIQVNFQSVTPPTQQQAKEIGATVSAEYLSLVNRLSARTM